ncbi:MAG: ATP-binding protein [Mycobacteriales bacterium]
MATNAVEHAGSPFRVVVHGLDGTVRIGVEDAQTAPPHLRQVGPHGLSGRGISVVAALARRWGYEPLPSGKVVWAELAA